MNIARALSLACLSLTTLAPHAARIGHADTGDQPVLETYRQLLRADLRDGSRPDVQQRLATLLLEKGAAAEQPITLLEQAIQADPRAPYNDRALYQLARAYQRAGKPQPMMRALTRLVDDYPTSKLWREAQFRRGEWLFEQRDYPAAIAAYRTLLGAKVTGSFQVWALYKLGWAHYRIGSLGPAQEFFFDVLDQLKSVRMELPTPEKEIADDSLRALTLCFARQHGTPDLRAYSGKPGTRPPYIADLYLALGQLYQTQQRPADAATVYAEFIQHYPDHDGIPWIIARAARASDEAGAPPQAQGLRLELVGSYDVTGDYWAKRDAEDRDRFAAEVEDAIYKIAEHYYAQARQSGAHDVYSQAEHWYTRYLGRYPNSPRAAEAWFMLGEAQLERHDYASAGVSYRRAAYEFPRHRYSAEAAYAEVLVWQERRDMPESTRSAGATDSMERFIKTFPDDDRWAAVSQRRAEDLFAARDFRAALTRARILAARLEATKKAVPPPLLALIAQSEFELGQYGAAEQVARKGLAAAASSEQKEAQIARIGAAAYRQGEQAYQKQRWVEAAAHFARVPKEVDLYPQAQYYGALAQMNAGNAMGAKPVLESFAAKYPNHEGVREVRERLAVLHEREGQWLEAAKLFELLTAGAVSQDQGRDSLWRAAQNYDKAKRPREAASLYERLTIWYVKPPELILEARLRLAAWYQSLGQADRQRAQLAEVAEKAPYVKEHPALRDMIVRAALQLADMDEATCRSIELKQPLQDALKRKKAALLTAVYYLTQVTGLAPHSRVTEANYRVGALYQDFATAVLRSERPGGLDAEERETYQVMLEEQAFPFEEKAINYFEKNLKASDAARDDPWLEKSRAALRKLKPATS